MDDLIAEDASYEQIARGILEAATEGPAGHWRMPWHALSGGLPENAFTGRRFRSTNLLTLAIAGRRKGYGANLWAPRA
jgi:antirestriction protein ArdC